METNGVPDTNNRMSGMWVLDVPEMQNQIKTLNER